MESDLQHLAGALGRAEFVLPTATSAQHAATAQHLVDQVQDYLLPRWANLDAPLLAVVGGSTGAGKSTLVNALVGSQVTRAGAIRPTTRDPVLVHHPEDASWFDGARILPGLPRIRSGSTSADSPAHDGEARTALHLVPLDSMTPGLALLDAPDVDSVVQRNREVAHQLLSAADLWLFVTTAHRYADAVPWTLLREAAQRNVVVAVVLDRVPAAVLDEVSADLAAMLQAQGLGQAPLFWVTETTLSPSGELPPGAVADLRHWLAGLTTDAQSRAEVVRRTLTGATQHAVEQARHVVVGLEEQADTAAHLRAVVEQAYRAEELDDALSDGALLRGEVLARWQDLVGAGEFFANLQARIGRVRDRVTAFLTRRPPPVAEAEEAITEGVHALLIAHADSSAERARAAWSREPAGRAVLGDAIEGRASAGFNERAAAQIRDWQRYLLDLVRDEGSDKRTTARLLALGVNGVGVALMIVVFASTGGLTGIEIGVAGGTAVVAQKVLEAVFGDEAVRRLTSMAREDLLQRVHELMAAEQQNFTGLLGEERAREQAEALAEACAAMRARMSR